MIAFKSCPRCHGDVYVRSYDDICCLQCGYEPRPQERAPVPAQRLPARPRQSVKAA